MRSRLLALVAVVGGLVALSPATAAAAPPACPTPPAAYTGSDATVAAITQQTIDADNSCASLFQELEQVDADVQTVNSTDQQGLGQVRTDVEQLHTDLAGPLPVSFAGGAGNAVSVTNWPADQTVGLDSGSTSALDGEFAGLHGDLWFLIGALIASFAFFNVVLPRLWP